MNKDLFIKECEKLNILIKEDILEKLDKYYSFLVENNKKFNLTAITDYEDVYLKHFYDSITLVKSKKICENISLCDFGTGAGFPGMIIAIIFNKTNVTLIESNGKKCIFLKELVNKLKLKNVSVVNQRVEEYAKSNREIFDIVTCRAVSSLKIISEIGASMVKKDGYMIFLKSSYDNELDNAKAIIKELGFVLKNVIDFELPIENSKRSILIFKKVMSTPVKYPRNYNLIIKNK